MAAAQSRLIGKNRYLNPNRLEDDSSGNYEESDESDISCEPFEHQRPLRPYGGSGSLASSTTGTIISSSRPSSQQHQQTGTTHIPPQMVELLDAAMEERRKLDRQDTINRLLQAERNRSPLDDEDLLSDDIDLEFECDTDKGLRSYSKRNNKINEKICLRKSKLARLDDELIRLTEEEKKLKAENANLLQAYDELKSKYLKQTSELNVPASMREVVNNVDISSNIKRAAVSPDDSSLNNNIPKQETPMEIA